MTVISALVFIVGEQRRRPDTKGACEPLDHCDRGIISALLEQGHAAAVYSCPGRQFLAGQAVIEPDPPEIIAQDFLERCHQICWPAVALEEPACVDLGTTRNREEPLQVPAST